MPNVAAAAGAGKYEEGEDEEKEGKQLPTSKAKRTAALEEAMGQGLSAASPKYLTPSEVREVLRRMWQLNEPILAYIYPTGGRVCISGLCGPHSALRS